MYGNNYFVQLYKALLHCEMHLKTDIILLYRNEFLMHGIPLMINELICVYKIAMTIEKQMTKDSIVGSNAKVKYIANWFVPELYNRL